MANYSIQNCLNNTVLTVDDGGNPISIGNTYYITFTGETNVGCFQVISISSDSPGEGILSATEYNNCLSCYQDRNWSFFVVSCEDPELSGPVNANQFNEWPVGKYYTLTPPPEFGFFKTCFYVIEPSEYYFDPVFTLTGPHDNCLCNNITYSAGTPYEVCVICDDCCGSGTTATSVSVPHPTWTRPDGSAVVLLDAVLLGGMFGLNS